MNNVENSEQMDLDILQCRADILRARNTNNTPATQNDAVEENIAEIPTYKNTDSIPIETILAKESAPLLRPMVSINKKEEITALREKPEIPSFNLAEDIMSEQRKITAIRRKAPGQRTETLSSTPRTQPTDYTTEQEKPAPAEQEKIIAEIVARDIERLCGGDYSPVST
ncbi:MAG: hypothetical protein PHY02_10245 [Phycisphaerae bacterium]|nr:hypothetical protein [Phycisphaerae bacterium]